MMLDKYNADIPYIKIMNLKKHFILGDHSVKAVDGVNLKINQGDRVHISGRSGSGKTTLLNLLGGIETPTSGMIYIDKLYIHKLNERRRIKFRRENLGFIFQSYNLLPQLTAMENVMIPLMVRGISQRNQRLVAKKMLSRVGLLSHKNHMPSEMSGGQQQRVGIARALVTDPSIVLADELTGNLDSKTGREILNLVYDIVVEDKKTLIMVSHDSLVDDYDMRRIEMNDGVIVSDTGAIEDNMSSHTESEEYNDYNDHVCERSNISVPDNVADDNVLRKKAIQEGIFGDIGIVDCVKNSD